MSQRNPKRFNRSRLYCEPLEARQMLTTWTVPVGVDGGEGSLRDILETANANGVDDVIQLDAGTYDLSVEGIDQAGLMGDFDFTEEGTTIHIRGAGRGATVLDAHQLDRIFDIYEGANVTISDLTLQNGLSGTQGGAIRNAGTLRLERVDAYANESIYGGALFNSGLTIIVDSSFTANTATAGGGLFNIGEMEIRDSLVDRNAADEGVGIWNGESIIRTPPETAFDTTRIDMIPAVTFEHSFGLSYADLDVSSYSYLSGTGTFDSRVGVFGEGHIGIGNFQAGTLTAGTIDDYEDIDELSTFVTDTLAHWGEQAPNILSQDPIVVTVTNGDGAPIGNAQVEIQDDTKTVLLDIFTGSDGKTIFLPAVDAATATDTADGTSFEITVTGPGGQVITPTVSGALYTCKITLDTESQTTPGQLDVALVIDVTGSMGDELEYLKVEIDSIAEQISTAHPDVDVRFSLVVYRDTGDEFVTRKFDFVSSVDDFQQTLMDQVARGGGNYPEAMHTALEDSEGLSWRTGNTARMLFLIADAPPHSEHAGATVQSILNLRQQGVRIFPVASSGVADEAETIMRTAAYATGGEYIFLTDHSGIGSPHATPNTDEYDVERLDHVMIRMVKQELQGEKIEPTQVIEHVVQSPQQGITGGALAVDNSTIGLERLDGVFHKDGKMIISESTVAGEVHAGDGFRQINSSFSGEISGMKNDVNGDGQVTPVDALIRINQFNAAAADAAYAEDFTSEGSDVAEPVTSLSILQIINELNESDDEEAIKNGPLDFLLSEIR